MDLNDFLSFLKSRPSTEIAEELLFRPAIHVFKDESEYLDYKNIILADHPGAHHISIMGSANWKFSLNPKKGFREFHRKSDIDIAVICADSYLKTWEDLRRYHREHYYALDEDDRLSLRRNGENVYSGFASPKWLPALTALKREHLKLTDRYSNFQVGYKSVNMMYFRNVGETIDYYVRGIRIASSQVRSG